MFCPPRPFDFAEIPLVLGVIAHAGDVHDHGWFVADHPGIVARREVGNVTGTKFQLAAVVHDHMQPAGNVILQVGSLAALSVHQRFDAGGPFPARLEA